MCFTDLQKKDVFLVYITFICFSAIFYLLGNKKDKLAQTYSDIINKCPSRWKEIKLITWQKSDAIEMYCRKHFIICFCLWTPTCPKWVVKYLIPCRKKLLKLTHIHIHIQTHKWTYTLLQTNSLIVVHWWRRPKTENTRKPFRH